MNTGQLVEFVGRDAFPPDTEVWVLGRDGVPVPASAAYVKIFPGKPPRIIVAAQPWFASTTPGRHLSTVPPCQ